MSSADTVAVIGMAGRFPGACDIELYWRLLAEGREGIRRFTEPDLLAAGVAPELVGRPEYVPARGVLDGAYHFDCRFFGFSPAEAATIDPQQRVFLECASGALDDAGLDPHRFPGLVGVYAGADAVPPPRSELDPLLAMIGREKDFLATRVAYKLGLRGPAVTVQTACSTSLTAIHTATQSLLAYECDAALAGGVSVGRPDQRGYRYQEGGILSRDGHCRPFDAGADGTVPSEGVGVVVLKRELDALRDGDRIVAVVRGSALNNDGGDKIGFTAPSLTGQREVIELAMKLAGVDPADIGYVEAHGTATRIGDPVEVQALTDAFRAGTDATGFCGLGAVKSNLGHTGAAAGVAGFIKAALMLNRGELVPTVHYRDPNPLLDLESTPFVVSTRNRPWPADGVRLAGVSSFGVGGTNAHAVLSSPPRPARTAVRAAPRVFVVSAASATGLDRLRDTLADRMAAGADLRPDDVAWTLAAGRRRFPHRVSVVADDLGQAHHLLRIAAPPAPPTSATPRVAFCFPGQGTLRGGEHAAAAYRILPGFRGYADDLIDLARQDCAIDLAPLLAPDTDPAWFADTVHQQLGLLVHGYALGRALVDWGVAPVAMLGNSIGEYVAATLAGVWTARDAVRVVAVRARAMRATRPGRMVAVNATVAELGDVVDAHAPVVVAVTGPATTVLSGPVDAVGELLAGPALNGFEVRQLDTERAFHSALMEPAAEALRAEIAGTTRSAPALPVISNVTGDWADADRLADPGYWAAQLRHQVHLAQGMTTLLDAECDTFVELGPGSSMIGGLRQHPAWRPDNVAVAPLSGAAGTSLLSALGQLWSRGLDLPLDQLLSEDQPRRCALPAHPLEQGDLARPDAEPPVLPVSTTRSDDSLRAVLAEHWREALGVSAVTDDADFFALGGESMALVHLLSRVRTRTGVSVSPSELATAPTFGRLHDLARRARGSAGAELVTLSATGAGTPLFLAADALGTTLGYRKLAELLGTDRPVYGVEPPAGRSWIRIEEIAELGVRAVRSARPRGPYLLGGWSFGAVVAYEMARRLLADGERVASLVCIDGYVPNTGGLPMVTSPVFAWDGLRLQVSAALGWGAAGALVRGEPDQRRRFAGSLRAVWRYRPRPLDCPAALFKAGRPDERLERLRRRLAGLYRGGLVVEPVGGGHWTLLTEPHVERLAAKVRVVLPAAENGPST